MPKEPANTASRRIAGRLVRRLRRFRGPGDVVDFLHIGALVMAAPVGLRVWGLRPMLIRQVRGAPAVTPISDGAADAALARAERLAHHSDVWLSRLRVRNPCLRRSFALFGQLRRAGLPVTFCVGIRTDAPLQRGEDVTGHAWLELEGQAILERQADISAYTVTFRFPPGPPTD